MRDGTDRKRDGTIFIQSSCKKIKDLGLTYGTFKSNVNNVIRNLQITALNKSILFFFFCNDQFPVGNETFTVEQWNNAILSVMKELLTSVRKVKQSSGGRTYLLTSSHMKIGSKNLKALHELTVLQHMTTAVYFFMLS